MVNLFKKFLKRGDGLSLDTDKPLDLNIKSDARPFEADFENEFGKATTTFGEPKFQEPMTPPIRDYRDSFEKSPKSHEIGSCSCRAGRSSGRMMRTVNIQIFFRNSCGPSIQE